MFYKIFLFVFLLSSILFSQDKGAFGVKIGIASSVVEEKWSDEAISKNKLFPKERISPQIEIFFQSPTFSGFDLETGLVYLQKGGENEFEISTISEPNGTGEKFYFDFQLDILQLNFNVRPKISFSNLTYFGVAGLQLNYIMSIKNSSLWIVDNDFYYGYRAGFGVEMENALAYPFQVEFIYENDISNFYENKFLEAWTRCFQLKIGFVVI